MKSWISLLSTVFVIAVATVPAAAQVVKSNSLPLVAETSRQNEARFDRDFRGKRFEDRITFAGMERLLLGGEGFRVRLGSNGFLHAAECDVSDKATIQRLIDSNVGDTLSVRGTIDRTIMGVVLLTNCAIR